MSASGQLTVVLFPAGPVIMSIEEKMEADGRSIYVGNVSLNLVLSILFRLRTASFECFSSFRFYDQEHIPTTQNCWD